tara:strand:+ start:9565 stop:10059 length:495 start_codon:yes stop_codon:yes gene_type:complete
MAIYPSIIPSARTYIPGDFPAVVQTTLAGSVAGFRRGNRRIEQKLQLEYENLTEAQVTTLRSHFDGQKGSYEIFYLSEACWSGYLGDPPVALVSDFAWIYAAPITITDGIATKWSASVELKTIPIDIGDLIVDGQDASDTWEYILEAGSASTSNQDYIFDGSGA